MSQLVALSLSIGVLGGVLTWLYLAVGLSVWAGFIAWACFFSCGGDTNALKQTIIGNIFGSVMAWIAAFLLLSTPTPAPIAVGVTVLVMCLAAHLKPLSSIPASVYGYAATFAYLLQTAQAMAIAELTAVDFHRNAMLLIVASMIGGAIFGLASGKVAGMLTKKA